jgi:predicted Zn-ribbon and HTH transcriptional regulator
MGTKIFGIIAAQNEDSAGETLLLDGLDHSRLFLARDEHEKDDFFSKIGAIRYTKKIYNKDECENDKQLRCWNHAQVPFLYGEGELADDEQHPNAESAAALLRFAQRPDVPLEVGFSIDGSVLERKDRAGNVTENKDIGKTLSKTLGLAAALTVKPCNPKCKAFLENDLTKSVANMPIPKIVLDAIKSKQAEKSFTEKLGKDWELFTKLEKLKKSLNDYFNAITVVRCNGCGDSVRFFKSSNKLPNFCKKCGSSFSLTNLWKALNK